MFRQFVDKHPVAVTNNTDTIVLNIMNELAALATTPLGETTDVSAVAPPAPDQVTVSLAEYGNVVKSSFWLSNTSYTAPDPALARILGLNMVDTMDALVQAKFDAGTKKIGKNGGVVKTDASGYAIASVAGTDTMDSSLVRKAVTLLRRRNVVGWDGMHNYVAIVHPDVAHDILDDDGWLAPHNYRDTNAIYNAEVGTYLGARFVQSPRTTKANSGVGSEPVYNTYFLGRQGVVEATIREPHTVIGPQIDSLRRINTLGWHAAAGWAVYRNDAIQLAQTASSIDAL